MKSTSSFLALLALLGCGGDTSTTTDGGNDGSAQDATTDSPTGDANNGGDTGSDGTTQSKPYTGSVSLTETSAQNTSFFTASAAFFDTPTGGTSGCNGTQSGSCCYTPPSDAGAPPTPTAVSAGGITIKDGSSTIASLTPNGTSYTPVSNPPTAALTWQAGDSIAISSAGDTVHQFSGTVSAVELFANVNPALSQIVPTQIDRTKDFAITWNAKTGAISVVLSAIKGLSTADGVIVCSSTSDSGTMTIPTALLSNIAATDTGTIAISRTSSSDASPDNATVTLSSSTSSSGKTSFK